MPQAELTTPSTTALLAPVVTEESGIARGAPRHRPFRAVKRPLRQVRCWIRGCLRSLEQTMWDSEPLTLTKVGQILSGWDRQAVAVRRLPSESHQVFEVTFRGQPCVAKFAGRDFCWKFVLQDELIRIQKAAAAGLSAPKVVLSHVNRLQNPFFIMPYLAAQPKASWTDEVRLAAWAEEASLIKTLPEAVRRARLPVKTEAQSVSELQREIADLRQQLVAAGLPRQPYEGVLDEFERVIRSRPWIIGQYQPPELVYDGQRFWAVDWDAFSYTHPLKWVNDFSFYDIVRDPKTGEEHLNFLLSALGFDPADPATRSELRLWQKFKAISVGSYVIKKDQRWEYFEVLKQRFFAFAGSLGCLLSAVYSAFEYV